MSKVRPASPCRSTGTSAARTTAGLPARVGGAAALLGFRRPVDHDEETSAGRAARTPPGSGSTMSRVGAVVGGVTPQSARHWGKEAWGCRLHRHAPAAGEAAGGRLTFVDGVEQAVERRRRQPATRRQPDGGANVIRQAFAPAGRRAEHGRGPGAARRRQAPLRGFTGDVELSTSGRTSRPTLRSSTTASVAEGGDSQPGNAAQAERHLTPPPYLRCRSASCPKVAVPGQGWWFGET